MLNTFYFIIKICHIHVKYGTKCIFFLKMYISVVGFMTQPSFTFVIFKHPRLVYSHAVKKVVWRMRGRGYTIIKF